MSSKIEAFNIYQDLKNSNAPKELLDKALTVVQSFDGGFENVNLSREDRQLSAETNLEKEKTKIDEVDLIIKDLVDAGAPEDLLKQAQEVRRVLTDPFDVREEVGAIAQTGLEGFTGGFIGDEAIAGLVSTIASGLESLGIDAPVIGGSDYESQLAYQRKIQEELFEQMPVVAYTTLIGTSLVPSSYVMKLVGLGKTATSGALRAGGVAGVEGFSYGFSEAEGDFSERLKEGAKLGSVSALIGGGFGAVLGKAEGRAIKAAEEVEKQVAKEKRARLYLQGNLTETIDGKVFKINPQADEVILAFQSKMDEYALKYFNETGKSLEGLDYGKALQQVSDELSVPIKKLRSAEAVTGKSVINFDAVTEQELRLRLGTLADDVGFVNGKYNPNTLVRWVRNHITSVQKMGEKYVGKRFGSQIQRTALAMARRHADTENIMSGSNVRAFASATKNDPEITRLLLNMSQIDLKAPAANLSVRRQAYNDLVMHLKTKYGDEAVNGFEAVRAKIQATSRERLTKMNSQIPLDEFYWPSQVRGTPDDGFITTTPNKKSNTSDYEQQRIQFQKGDPAVSDYVNPADRALDWLRRSDSELAMIDAFKLKNLNTTRTELARKAAAGDMEAKAELKNFNKRVLNGDALFDEVERVSMLEGADKLTAEKAQDLMRSLIVMGSRGPSGFIAGARQAAYSGLLGNPYSAVLNVGDVFNSFVNYGTDNTVDALVDMMRMRGVNMSVEDVGLARQATGEFIRDGVGPVQVLFKNLNEKAFKLSGFTTADRFGKNVALRAGIKEGQQLARSGKLKEKWGHAFTDNEMARLTKDLLQGKKTNLTTEFAAAQLARLQPSDMAQLPKWYLDNPNWRVLYMLRTFALKQFDQIENLVVQEWKAGNKKEAIKNGLAYSIYVGGGNAFINEGRQILKGDEPKLENIRYRWADHMLSAATLNIIGTYQLERAEGGDEAHMVASVAPAPLSMAFAPIVDLAQFGFGEKDMEDFLEKSESVGWLPFARLAQHWLKD